MTEKELITKIRKLSQIEPRKDWVIFTKERILGEEFKNSRERVSAFGWSEFVGGIRILFQRKFAFASLSVVIIFGGLLGTFGFAQNSLPGNSLYILKKITEKTQAVFVSEENQARYNLKIVNERLDDLIKIAQTNKINNLASAIEGVQRSKEKAVKSLNDSEVKKDPTKVKEIVIEVKKLEESQQRLEKVYGISGLGENKEKENPTKVMVEWLIEDAGNSSLTEDQEKSLAGAIKDYEEGNYSQALEEILLLSQ